MDSLSSLSQRIWDLKYRLKDDDGAALDLTIEDSWRRMAHALAAPEAASPEGAAVWENRFYDALKNFTFLPAGRIQAGAGSDRKVTLFNCFVMGQIPDDMSGIFEHLKEAALTLQQGGGIGYDFSSLRPRGAPVKGVGADASGPLSFMDVWDAMCRTIMSAGSRRGAMMATLACDHPDIEDFITAKQTPGRLRMFNLSVLVSDAFMKAVQADAEWALCFKGTVFKKIKARDLWQRILQATYDYAEPGVIFIDRINRRNNLWYCEHISATNPCGEQPLPSYGACLLGSVNLATLVEKPFETGASLNRERLAEVVALAVRMLDNTIDVSGFPLPQQKHEAKSKRRIGLGITGLADALIMCGLRYGSAQAVETTKKWMACFRRAAYHSSIQLAEEKGAFPLFETEAFLQGESIQELDQDLKTAIARHGIRNALVTSVAPTGTISLLAGNLSSGLEPVFSFQHKRHILMPDGSTREEEVQDFAYRLFREIKGGEVPLPDYFVDAQSLSPGAHLVMQSAVQAYIDSSVSKTINLPEDISFEAFGDVYQQAYDMGCKGCTTYRPNPITGAVLEAQSEEPKSPATPNLSVASSDKGPLKEKGSGGNGADSDGAVVYMTDPLERPEALPGRTYKLKWPESGHAIYITVNDVIQDGRRRPFEIFINSKNMEHYAWTLALTRMISAVFRRGGDVSFVVEELKAVFDPRGGAWMEGRYVPSLLAAIGSVIEGHMIEIGFLPNPKEGEGPDHSGLDQEPRTVTAQGLVSPDERTEQALSRDSESLSVSPRLTLGPACPRCGTVGLIHQEGCDLCTACGYSKCG
ncbi:MAG: adenosylcobalamin-dependent ribonucleoside-diphosphate reductase [Pseudomonadota bacterium]